VNVLFNHVSSSCLGHPQRPSGLFELFGEFTFFEQSLLSQVYSSDFDLIQLVSPEKEVSFFQTKLNDFYSKISKRGINPEKNKMTPVKIEGIPETLSYSFSPVHSVFHPLSMETQDFFGLWSLEGWDALSAKTKATRLLIMNLESFWYLKKEHLEVLLQATLSSDFSFSGEGREDLLLGMDVQRIRLQVSRLRNTIKRKYLGLKENYQYWTGRSIASEKANQITRERNTRLDDLQKKEANRTLYLMPPQVPPQLNDLIRGFRKEGFPFSLRNHSGQFFSQVNVSMENRSPFQEIRQQISSEMEVQPQVLRVQLNEKGKTLDPDSFLSVIKPWKASPFCILTGEKDPAGWQEFREFLSVLRKYFSGRIYVESPSLDLTPEMLHAYYTSGIDVWVFCVDPFCKKGSVKDPVLRLDEAIHAFLLVRDMSPGRFFLLQVQNTLLQDIDFIPLLLQKWQYLVDGIVVTGDPIAGTAYQARAKMGVCTKVPYEIVLHSNGKFSLCSQIKEGSLDSKNAWLEAIPHAGTMEICMTCPVKNSYGGSQWPGYQGVFHESSVFSLFKGIKFALLEAKLEKKEFAEALEILEELLKFEPFNERLWKTLERIKTEYITL
jgi:hypothetical protein